MKRPCAAVLCAFLLGCAAEGEYPKPSEAEIDRVEARLADHPCVGSLDSWERNYRYGERRRTFWPQIDHADLDVITFHLRRAGTVEIIPGRAIFSTGSGDWPDSRAIRAIDGSLVLSSGRLSVSRCQAEPKARSS
ncbi:hypothetical protein [Sphingomonas daechungensis]|uniref:hypothetical protein n=1 Tax=Sphingomonas daechungensis TaxID=1176646 RepID=UPI0031F178EB